MAKEEKKPDQEAGPEADQAAAGKKKKMIIIGGIVGGVLLLGGGGAFFFLGGKGHKAPEGEAASAEATGHGGAEKPAEAGGHGEAAKVEGGHGEAPKAEGGHGEAAKAEGGHGGGGGGKEGAKPADGEAAAAESKVVDVTGGRSMVINLKNPAENRAVKIAVSVLVKVDKEGKIVSTITTERNALFRDVIISVVGAQSRERLLSTDGKDALRAELLNRFNERAMGGASPVIEDVFITDFYIE